MTLPIKQCPKCKAKVKYARLVDKYFCKDCEEYFELRHILHYYHER